MFLFRFPLFPSLLDNHKCKLLTPPGTRKKFKAISFVPLIATPRLVKPGPMVRIVFEDGTATKWHSYQFKQRKRLMAIETCAPDANGVPRFAQLKIG